MNIAILLDGDFTRRLVRRKIGHYALRIHLFNLGQSLTLQMLPLLRIFDGYAPGRGAGAVELATLERWYTRKGIVGSNPTLSAVFTCLRAHNHEKSTSIHEIPFVCCLSDPPPYCWYQ